MELDYRTIHTLPNFINSDTIGTRERNVLYPQLDYIINGKSLSEVARISDGPTLFGKYENLNLKEIEKEIDRFSLQNYSIKKSENIPLYLCTECADLYCGFNAVTVTYWDGKIIWHNFSRLSDEEDENPEIINNLIFIFSREIYSSFIENLKTYYAI